jgi:WD40 repeat protein
VTVWDAVSGKVAKTHKVKPVEETAQMVKTGAMVSPGGTHFVQQFLETGTGNAILRVFDLATGESRPEIKLAVGGAQNINFSPDGKLLAWSSLTDGVTIWNMADHKEAARFGRDGMKVKLFGNSIRFADDGKTVAVTLANDAIELWDVEKQKLIRTLGGYKTEPQHRVAVRLAIGAGDRMTRSDLAISPDGKVVAASLGNATVRQFDTATGNEISPAAGHLSGVVAVGSSARTVVSVSKESVRVWEPASGREVRQWPLSPPAVAAAVSADGRRVATSSGNGVVRLWDPATGEKALDIQTKRSDVAGLGFTPDGKLLATKAELNSAINLWEVATGNHVRTIGQDGEPVLSGGRVMIDYSGVQTPAIVFSADGRLIAAAGDRKQLGVWSVATGSKVCEVASPPTSIGVAFAISADGHVLAMLTNTGLIAGYEVATGEQRFELKMSGNAGELGRNSPIAMTITVNTFSRGDASGGGLGFTPDGRYVVVSGSGSSIRIWDTLSGEEAGNMKGHQGGVSVLRVSPDGRSLITGSVDTTAMIWDLGQLSRIDFTRQTPLSTEEIELLWGDLAKSDAKHAFIAARKLLTDRASAVKLLSDRLRPVPKVDDARIAQLVSELGGGFAVRRKAAEELERLGEQAIPQIQKGLEGNPPLELKQRLERLLEKVNVQKPVDDRLREWRAIELLQLAATPEAKAVLESLAGGAPGARMTREAVSALDRMSK